VTEHRNRSSAEPAHVDESLRHVIELVPTAAYLCDSSGTLTFFNDRAARLWGRQPQSGAPDRRFCGSLRFWNMDGTPLQDERLPPAIALLQGRITRNQMLLVERPDGTRVPVSVDADPIRDGAGRIVGAVSLVHETPSALAENAQAWLAAIVESSDDAIVSKDLDGVITSWNQGAQKLFGYTASEIVGRPVTVLIPRERLDEEALILSRIRSGQRVDQYETVRRHKDGTSLPVSLTVSPILDARGTVIGASKIARDISATKSALDALARDKAALSQLHDVAHAFSRPDASFTDALHTMLDAAILITESDKGTVQLYDEESGALKIVAHRGFDDSFLEFFKSVGPDEAGACGAALARAERVLVADVATSPVLARDDVRKVLIDAGVRAVQSTPLLSTSGTPLGMLSTHYREPRRLDEPECRLLDVLARQAADYLERRRDEQQREQLLRIAERARLDAESASQVKDEFLAMLGHELRNPLAALRNAVTVATLDARRRPRALEIARSQTEQLAGLVDDLLDVARFTQGQVSLRRTRVSVHDVLQRSLDATRPAMEERRHVLNVELPAEPVHLDADAVRIEQAITNLLTNSAKYTGPEGSITVAAEREGDMAVIRVRDNGVGIAPESLTRIFELFAQGERTLDRAPGGLGIGLTLVRRIAELHGGSIEALSPGLGQGAEFVLRLPALPAATMSEAPESDELIPAMRARAARILLVEDHEDSAEGLAMLIELLGHDVRVVRDGHAALAAIGAERPDLAFIDIGLPGMDGYAVARRIRSDQRLNRLVLVALTGYGMLEDKKKAISAGFDDHLVKPVSPKRLGEVIAGVISRPA
jgi:PAS domain S-box-containing protein